MKKPCINCQRPIDSSARLCPYCNADQVLTASERQGRAEQAAAPPPAPIAPPSSLAEDTAARLAKEMEQRPWMTRALVIGALGVFLMAIFAIGGLVYGLGRNRSPVQQRIASGEPIGEPTRDFPDLTLVTEADPTSTIGRSITTSPIPDPDHKMPPEYQRTDATALPSAEYARILTESSAQSTSSTFQSVDPRTITAPPVPPPRPKPKPQPEPEGERSPVETASQTRPEPISQPMPYLNSDGTARFILTVGTDGRVKEVRVLETIPGKTSQMIGAIQRWRFKPATRDGVAVEAEFPVDISFVRRND